MKTDPITITVAVDNWRKFRAGEALDKIYPLTPDWPDHHEGTPDAARQQRLAMDATTIADAHLAHLDRGANLFERIWADVVGWAIGLHR